MKLMPVPLLLVLGAVGVLGGCADELAGKVTSDVASASASPAPSPTSSPKPSPSPTESEDEDEDEMSISAAAAEYVSLSDAMNIAMGEANKTVTYEEVIAVAPRMAEAHRTFATGLTEAQWPAEVQASIDLVAAESLISADAWDATALAATDAEIADIWLMVPTTNSSPQVREFLGLPPGVIPEG